MVAVSDDTATGHPRESRHVSVWVDATAAAAYEYISDPANLSRWVAGLDLSAVTFQFAPVNEFGVLDHVVGIGDVEFYNPMRVLPAGVGPDGCELVFSVRRRAGMTDAEFDADAAAVTADLQTLRGVLENELPRSVEEA
jgi:hypothetical protein